MVGEKKRAIKKTTEKSTSEEAKMKAAHAKKNKNMANLHEKMYK